VAHDARRPAARKLPCPIKGRIGVISSAIYAICLLSSATGAEPPGVAYARQPVLAATGAESQTGMEAELSEAEYLGLPSPVACPVCRAPEPFCCALPYCRARWYTAVNAEYHWQPYNYRVRFDYPWHVEPGCASCWQTGVPLPAFSQSPAVLAPPNTAKDVFVDADKMSRPSAIRSVD